MKIVGSFVFTICDENLDFNQIKNKINLGATKIVKRGEVTLANIKAPFDIWSFEIKITDEIDIMDYLNTLLDKLIPYSSYIKEISKCYNQVSINCFLRSEFGQIGFEMSNNIINKLNRIGININFHILSYGGVE